MNHSKKNLDALASAVIIWLALNNTTAMGDTLAVTGDWQYQHSEDNPEALNQRFSSDFSKSIALTNIMSLQTAVRYDRNRGEESVAQNLNPTAAVSVNNDIFTLNLSGNANEKMVSNTADLSNRTWEVNWGSAWEKTWKKPGLQLFYGENSSQDDLQVPAQDQGTTNGGARVDWDLGREKFFYSYTTQESIDEVAMSTNVANNHLARAEAERDLWDDRISLGISHNYSLNQQDIETRTDASGQALLQVSISQTVSGEDDTPEDGALAPTPELSDNVKDAQALVINNPVSPMNIGLKVEFQTIDLIYLYTVDDESVDAGTFRWDLYVSNDGISWTRQIINATTVYNAPLKRFEIETGGVQNRYLKVVAVQDPLDPIAFSEVAAYDRVTAGSLETLVLENDQTTNLTDVSLGLALRPDLGLAYNFAYENRDFSSGSNVTRKQLTSNLRWNPSHYFAANLNASTNLQQRGFDAETLTRAYGLSFITPPLPTVDVVTAMSHTESFEGATKLTTGQNYNLHVNAELYPDLDSRLDTSYTNNIDEATSDLTSTIDSRLAFIARLVPKLVVDVLGSYNKILGEDASSTTKANLNFNWRPSDMLSFRTSMDHTWSTSDSDNLALNINLAPTEKIQLTTSYAYSFSTEAMQTYGLNLRWAISKYISMISSGNYRIRENDSTWSVDSRLTTRYSPL